MQGAKVEGFDEDTHYIILKEEKVGKFMVSIYFWLFNNEYWVYINDRNLNTDMPITCKSARDALGTFDAMKRFIEREIVKS